MNRKKKKGSKTQASFPAWLLFLTGFLLGTVLPNLAWKLEWKQKAISSVYLLGTVSSQRVSGIEYLTEVLRIRGSFLALAVLCGFSVFGLPLAVAAVVGTGMEMGAVLAVSILQFGLAGGAVGLGLMLPQMLVYIPATFFLMALIYSQSLEMWKNQGLFPQKISRYIIGAGAGMVLYLAGILLEVYVNPWIVEKILNSLKFF